MRTTQISRSRAHPALAPTSVRGFTLLEVMSVVVMIGTLSALAMARISDITKRDNEHTEVRLVMNSLERARDRAHAELCAKQVQVDSSAGQITIGPVPGEPNAYCASRPNETTKVSWLLKLKLFPGAGASPSTLVFTPSGALQNAEHAILNIRGVQSRNMYLLDVWPGTGVVRLKQ